MIFTILGQLQSYLITNPLSLDTTNPVYILWYTVKDLSNVCAGGFVLVLIVAQITQNTPFGLSNYNIKNGLPKIFLGAILANTSYFWIAPIFGAFNVLGDGIATLALTILQNAQLQTNGVEWSGLFSLGVIGLGAILLQGQYLLPLFVTLLVAAAVIYLVAIVILIARQIILIAYTLAGPLAVYFWFGKWFRRMVQWLMMYPMIMLLLSAGKILGALVVSGMFTFSASNGFADSLAQAAAKTLATVAAIAPLAALPWVLPMSRSLTGKMQGYVMNGLTSVGNWGSGLGPLQLPGALTGFGRWRWANRLNSNLREGRRLQHVGNILRYPFILPTVARAIVSSHDKQAEQRRQLLSAKALHTRDLHSITSSRNRIEGDKGIVDNFVARAAEGEALLKGVERRYGIMDQTRLIRAIGDYLMYREDRQVALDAYGAELIRHRGVREAPSVQEAYERLQAANGLVITDRGTLDIRDHLRHSPLLYVGWLNRAAKEGDAVAVGAARASRAPISLNDAMHQQLIDKIVSLPDNQEALMNRGGYHLLGGSVGYGRPGYGSRRQAQEEVLKGMFMSIINMDVADVHRLSPKYVNVLNNSLKTPDIATPVSRYSPAVLAFLNQPVVGDKRRVRPESMLQKGSYGGNFGKKDDPSSGDREMLIGDQAVVAVRSNTFTIQKSGTPTTPGIPHESRQETPSLELLREFVRRLEYEGDFFSPGVPFSTGTSTSGSPAAPAPPPPPTTGNANPATGSATSGTSASDDRRNSAKDADTPPSPQSHAPSAAQPDTSSQASDQQSASDQSSQPAQSRQRSQGQQPSSRQASSAQEQSSSTAADSPAGSSSAAPKAGVSSGQFGSDNISEHIYDEIVGAPDLESAIMIANGMLGRLQERLQQAEDQSDQAEVADLQYQLQLARARINDGMERKRFDLEQARKDVAAKSIHAKIQAIAERLRGAQDDEEFSAAREDLEQVVRQSAVEVDEAFQDTLSKLYGETFVQHMRGDRHQAQSPSSPGDDSPDWIEGEVTVLEGEPEPTSGFWSETTEQREERLERERLTRQAKEEAVQPQDKWQAEWQAQQKQAQEASDQAAAEAAIQAHIQQLQEQDEARRRAAEQTAQQAPQAPPLSRPRRSDRNPHLAAAMDAVDAAKSYSEAEDAIGMLIENALPEGGVEPGSTGETNILGDVLLLRDYIARRGFADAPPRFIMPSLEDEHRVEQAINNATNYAEARAIAEAYKKQHGLTGSYYSEGGIGEELIRDVENHITKRQFVDDPNRQSS